MMAKKMRRMKQIDRRISVAPMMDWTDLPSQSLA
jgi:tRNA-dihydrouridine synthase